MIGFKVLALFILVISLMSVYGFIQDENIDKQQKTLGLVFMGLFMYFPLYYIVSGGW